ncbi:hypothetical protein CRUP_003458, partial [Coryphaenoides rupestris]
MLCRPLTRLCVTVAFFASVFSATDAQISNRYVVGCPSRCDPASCPRLPANCAAGETLDVCSCCSVCASGEGEACGGGGAGKLGDPVCAEGMECSFAAAGGGAGGGVGFSVTVRRRSKSGVCVCRAGEPVCGSDGVSYRNVCELKR